MENTVPVVYLAFANELDDHLAELKNESRAIFKVLLELEKENKIRVHREESSQVDELHQDLLAYDQDIVIFHYGGHADGSMLQLEGGRGNAGGLAKMLGQQKSLKLVFLNGCATKDQVMLLHRAGVPAVIATSVKINDSKATVFATAFYESLAKGYSIEESFESGKNLLETKFSDSDIFDVSFNRFPQWDDEDEVDNEEAEINQGLEWALYTREDAQTDINQWRLSTAQTEWQVQLSDAQGVIRSAIDDQPLYISHRSVQRNLSAGSCTQCSTTLLSAKQTASSSSLCPVCLADKLETGDASTAVPDQVLDFAISERRANSISSLAFKSILADGKQSGELSLEDPVAVWLPFWKFNTAAVSNFEGESAFPAGIAEGKPTLEWRKSAGRLDSSLDDFLVSGSKAPVANVRFDGADLQALREYSSVDSTQLSLVCDKTIEQAFFEASDGLHENLNVQIKERLGGVDQRNVKSTVRYDKVGAQLVWLPKWIVSAKLNDRASTVLIDGRTGQVDVPRITGLLSVIEEGKNTMSRKSFSLGDEPSRATLVASLFGGVGIGLMVGLLMGLAAPTGPEHQNTVSIFIGAVGVALAALLGLNDRHFSIAKGLRIGSFGVTVALSALGGIYVRDHGLLSPSIEEKVETIARLAPSMSRGDIVSLLSADMGTKKLIGAAVGGGSQSVLYSQELDLNGCDELTQNPYEASLSFEDLAGNFKLQGGIWAEYPSQVKQNIGEPDKKQALLLLRDLHCGENIFKDAPLVLSKQDCIKLKQPTDAPLAAIEAAYKSTNMSAVSDYVGSRVSVDNKKSVLTQVINSFCAS